MKLYLSPHADDVQQNNGIGQVVKAQYEHLPKFGIEFVHDPGKADIVAAHVRTDLDYLDVLHCHGLYWTAELGRWLRYHHRTNLEIVSAARKARKITVPSTWVAEVFKREMRISPEVIGHGVNLKEWKRGKNEHYILWNKNRISPACNPEAIIELHKHGLPTVSTLGAEGMNLVGVVSFEEMKQLIQSAGIYLSTSKETFGIGTLEAMACGIPVLGYAFGGNLDLIDHLESGYLVEEGSIDGLIRGYAYIKGNYHHMSKQAKRTAMSYDWGDVMQNYASLYYSLMAHPETHRTAVIITNYNYGKYLENSVSSVWNQSLGFDELIIVDDGSTDNSQRILDRIENHGYVLGPKLKVIRQKNQGVAAARNAGIRASSADYICCLDADDKLDPDFLRVLLPEIKSRRELGIVYSGLEIFSNDGSSHVSRWPPAFDWEVQSSVSVPPSNCIPSACLFRRDMWERAGGIIQQGSTPAEDVEFWTRGLSFGFEAKKVTDRPLFKYRLHHGQAHTTKKYKRIDNYLPWMSSKDYLFASPSDKSPSVRSYSDPVLSVIVPVGPNHQRYLNVACESIFGQSFRDWEIIVVNDTGEEIEAPVYAKVVDCDKRSAGAARNLGVESARGKLIYFLDADDYLLPNAFDSILSEYQKINGEGYVYTAYAVRGKDGNLRNQFLKPFDPNLWKGQHAVNILISKSDFLEFGIFDESLSGWEDYDLQLKLQTSGICGNYLPTPTFVYRQDKGFRRNHSFDNKDKLLKLLKDRYWKFFNMSEGVSCCNSDNEQIVKILLSSKRFQPRPESFQLKVNNMELIRMEYTGSNSGAIPFQRVSGKKLSRTYRGGSNPNNKFANATPEDAELLVKTGKWRIVEAQTQPQAPDLVEQNPPLPAFEPADEPVSEPADQDPEPKPVEIIASQKVRDEAENLGVNLEDVTGTGKDGRITVADVRNHNNSS